MTDPNVKTWEPGGTLPPEVWEEIQEREAILQYDAGYSFGESHMIAYRMVLERPGIEIQ